MKPGFRRIFKGFGFGQEFPPKEDARNQQNKEKPEHFMRSPHGSPLVDPKAAQEGKEKKGRSHVDDLKHRKNNRPALGGNPLRQQADIRGDRSRDDGHKKEGGHAPPLVAG